MRRDINWKTKRPDGSVYFVRVTWFSGRFRLQFCEGRHGRWEYDRVPSREDLETFLDAIERRYQRREATLREMEEARRMLAAGAPTGSGDKGNSEADGGPEAA